MKNQEEDLKSAMTIMQFISDHKINDKISEELSKEIEQLFLKHKKDTVDVGDVLIIVETGLNFGNIEIKNVFEIIEPRTFSYKSGYYDYVSVFCDLHIILWTDYDDTEPYNRQGSFYIGHSFDGLNVERTENNYRELSYDSDTKINSSFAIWGFNFNNFWGTLRFGICIDSNKKDKFLSSLRKLLNK